MVTLDPKKRKEFEKMLAESNPSVEKVFELAETPWQKAVAIAFFIFDGRIGKISKDMKWTIWLIRGIFAAIVFNIVIQIPRIVELVSKTLP